MLLLVGENASEPVDPLFEAIDAHDCEDVRQAVRDDSEADDGRKHAGGDIKILQAAEAQHCAAHAEQQQDPPHREAHFLVVEALNGDDYTLDHDPEGEDYRQGNGRSEDVEQEEAAEADVEQRAKCAGAAVGQECLGPDGEDEFGDTCDEGQAAEYPCGGYKRDVWFGNTHYAENDKKEACDAEPDFSTCFHVLKVLFRQIY